MERNVVLYSAADDRLVVELIPYNIIFKRTRQTKCNIALYSGRIFASNVGTKYESLWMIVINLALYICRLNLISMTKLH